MSVPARICRDCVAEGVTTRRPAPHPGPRCATHRRAAESARKARAHERRVQQTYGLEPGQYELLLAAQGRRCAICQKATGARRRLAVDHDHETGEVRGLLCKPCNYVLLGRYPAPALERALAYLANPPARAVLGGDR